MKLMRMELMRMKRVEEKQTRAHSASSKDVEGELIASAAAGVVLAAVAAVPEPAFESVLQVKQVEVAGSSGTVPMDSGPKYAEEEVVDIAAVVTAAVAVLEPALGPIHFDSY